MNNEIIQQFNRWAGENKSQLAKALTGAANSGGALIPQHLEAIITNALPRISPELAMVTPQFDNQSTHEFNRLTALGGIGGAMGESAVTPVTQPTFTRANVALKVVRRKGATTNFLQNASKKNVDSAATNIESELISHVHDLCNYNMYGNAVANPWEYSGLDTFIATNRFNKTSGGVVPTNLKELDDLIDANFELQGMAHKKAFVMSPQMLSKFSQLLTNVRLNQGLSGSFSQVDIPGGWRLNAYRDVPIIVSSGCRPKTTMPVVTPAAVIGTGAIADNLPFFFQVAGITKNGEEIACAEVTVTTAGGGGNDNYITLTWAANTQCYRYKIYVGTVAGTVYLRHIIPGFTYDANGTKTVSDTDISAAADKRWTSDANGNVTSMRFQTTPATVGAEVPVGMRLDIPLNLTALIPPEVVVLWDLDEFQGIGRMPYTNEGGSQFNGLVTIEDLARTDDFLPFLIKTYGALADSFEATCAMVRGLRVV